MAQVSSRPGNVTKGTTSSAGKPKGNGSTAPRKNTKPAGKDRRGTFLIIGAFVAMAVLAVVVALVATGGDDQQASGGLSQYQKVSVQGTLPQFSDSKQGDDAGGAASPVITGKTFAGNTIVAPTPGRATILAFVAHWCPHCQKEVPLITQWWKDGAGQKDVDLVAIATGTNEARPNYPPSSWLVKESWPGRVIADDKDQTAAKAFGLSGYPYLVFVGADGKVKSRISGEKTVQELDAELAKIVPSGTATPAPQG